MKSVYYLPSNRDCRRALLSYVKEIEFAQEKYGRNIPLVVSETNDGNHVLSNKDTIHDLHKVYSDLQIFHMTKDIQRQYFERLLSGECDEIKDAILSPSVNYGTAMNKLFLMTASFGADALHRRDSDTCLIFDEVPDAQVLFPIEMELKFLGRTIADLVADNAIQNDNLEISEREVWVVGGNYFGEWNMDVKDFAKLSMTIVYHLYDILGFDKEYIVDICNEAFQFDPVFKQIEQISLVTSVSDGLNPDCGNVAIFKLHEHLPAVPGRNMLAADYFPFDIATALGVPTIHHTRSVFHTYHNSRFVPENKLRYWEAVAKFADYFNLYMALFNRDLDAYFNHSQPFTPPRSIINYLIGEISRFSSLNTHQREIRIERIAREVLIPFNNDYAIIGNKLRENCQEIIKEDNFDYMLHCLLLDRWATLIDRAKNIDIMSLFSL